MLFYMKPILAFYMGYSEPFNGFNYKHKNVFGSEINTIKLAEALTHLYNLTIFVNIEETDEIIYNNALEWGFTAFRGSELNVLDRFYKAAKLQGGTGKDEQGNDINGGFGSLRQSKFKIS